MSALVRVRTVIAMSPLAVELLQRHKAQDQRLFYGDSSNSGDLPERESFFAVDNAYKELMDAGLVDLKGVVSIRGRPCSTYKISETGKTAQAVRPQS